MPDQQTSCGILFVLNTGKHPCPGGSAEFRSGRSPVDRTRSGSKWHVCLPGGNRRLGQVLPWDDGGHRVQDPE